MEICLFPVCSTPNSWLAAKTSQLRLIDQSLLGKIENEQPFKRGKRYQRHWLWLLNELWNRDKHRSVTIVATYGLMRALALLPAEDETMSQAQLLQEFDVEMLSSHSVGRYVDGMKLGQFRVTRKRPGLPEPEVKLDVETTLRLGIKFKKTAPTYGSGVLDALEGLSADVERVLDLFDADFK